MAPTNGSGGWGVWKWIGCGCGGCLLAILLVIAFVAAVGGLAFLGMSQNDAYQQAVEHARLSPEVIAVLGEPIEAGLFTSGSVNVSGPSGSAELAIPVSGPEGSGTLYVVAEKSAGEWRFTTLELEVEGATGRLDLLVPEYLEDPS